MGTRCMSALGCGQSEGVQDAFASLDSRECVGMRVSVKIALVAVQVKGACSRSWRMQEPR